MSVGDKNYRANRRAGFSHDDADVVRSSAERAAKRAKNRQLRREMGADYLHDGLCVVGWLATTVLASAGLFVVLFVMAGNGSPDGFFTQVNLLAAHYLAADAARRASFDGQAMIFIAVVVMATGFFRRAALTTIFRTGGAGGPQRIDRG